VIVELLSWRWIFFVNVPIGGSRRTGAGSEDRA